MKNLAAVTVSSVAIFALFAFAAACCSVSASGKPVRFGDQSNIIVWNPNTGTEHFIRDAKFTSKATDFGFIAPTPTRPDMAAASSQAFTALAGLAPKAVSFGCGAGDTAAAGAAAAPLTVIQEADVAGYHATTLLASDSKALAAWMKKHGYRTTPGIEKWTDFYIRKGWYLTAFKVENELDVADTGVVMLSFKTNRPFNPYYVPDDNIDPENKGVLRVFFVAPQAYVGLIGGVRSWKDAKWKQTLPDNAEVGLAKELSLPQTEIPKNATVEMFEDYDFPISGSDDIYFVPDRSFQWTKDLVIAFAILGLILLVRARSRALHRKDEQA